MGTRLDKEILTKAGENMLHILICDDDRTFADFLSQQITLLPEFDRRCMKITTLDDPHTIAGRSFIHSLAAQILPYLFAL